MGYGIMARGMNVEGLEQAFGAGPNPRLTGWLQPELARLDQEIPDEPAGGRILRDLLERPDYLATQDSWTPLHTHKAIRLLELLTGWFGDPDPLPNRHWSAMNYGWFGAVDDALARAGSPARASMLTEPHSLAGFPIPVEFPIIHITTADQARQWLAQTDGLDLSATPKERDAVEQLRGWLSRVVEQDDFIPGQSLITFYY